MNNKTQRRIHKYFLSHYFCFVFFRKNNIRGNAATNNTPNEGKKNHQGKVKEVERLQGINVKFNFKQSFINIVYVYFQPFWRNFYFLNILFFIKNSYLL
jgi:hypothetical protein